MDLKTKEYLHSPHIGLAPRPTKEMPKPQPTDVPIKEQPKSDINQLLLLGLGAIIVILLLKK